VDALRNIHSALVPGGLLVDTQPVSAHPVVTAGEAQLGAADLRPWADTVRDLDRRAAPMLDNGDYRVVREERFIVTDSFSGGPECVETMRGWRGTLVPDSLAKRLADIDSEVEVHQQVRLRLLRTADDSSGGSS
jgi:hypothetical protein